MTGLPALARPSQPGGIREILAYAAPVAITMLSEALMGAVDTAFVGWTERAPAVLVGLDRDGLGGLAAHVAASDVAGTVQQGAVGLGSVLVWTLLSIVTGLLSAVVPLVAQNHGARQPEACARYTWQAVYLALLGTVYGGFLALVGPAVLPLIGATPDVVPHASSYLQVRCVGAVFFLVNFALVGFFRGVGDTRTPLWIGLAANAANVVLNFPLIFGLRLGPVEIPALGVTGAALATVASQAVATVIYLRCFLRAVRRSAPAATGLHRPILADLGRLVRLGLPIGGNWFLENASWMVFTVFVSRIGESGLAAHVIVQQLMHLSFLPTIALFITATALVGKYLGRGEPAVAERAGWSCFRVALIYVGMMAVFFLTLRGPLLGVFTRDPAVIRIARDLILIMTVAQLLDAVGIVSAGVIRGAGDTRYAFYVSFGSSWLVFVPAIYVLGTVVGWGIYGAWLGTVLYLAVQAVLLLHRFVSGRWKHLPSLAGTPRA